MGQKVRSAPQEWGQAIDQFCCPNNWLQMWGLISCFTMSGLLFGYCGSQSALSSIHHHGTECPGTSLPVTATMSDIQMYLGDRSPGNAQIQDAINDVKYTLENVAQMRIGGQNDACREEKNRTVAGLTTCLEGLGELAAEVHLTGNAALGTDNQILIRVQADCAQIHTYETGLAPPVGVISERAEDIISLPGFFGPDSRCMMHNAEILRVLRNLWTQNISGPLQSSSNDAAALDPALHALHTTETQLGTQIQLNCRSVNHNSWLTMCINTLHVCHDAITQMTASEKFDPTHVRRNRQAAVHSCQWLTAENPCSSPTISDPAPSPAPPEIPAATDAPPNACPGGTRQGCFQAQMASEQGNFLLCNACPESVCPRGSAAACFNQERQNNPPHLENCNPCLPHPPPLRLSSQDSIHDQVFHTLRSNNVNAVHAMVASGAVTGEVQSHLQSHVDEAMGSRWFNAIEFDALFNPTELYGEQDFIGAVTDIISEAETAVTVGESMGALVPVGISTLGLMGVVHVIGNNWDPNAQIQAQVLPEIQAVLYEMVGVIRDFSRMFDYMQDGCDGINEVTAQMSSMLQADPDSKGAIIRLLDEITTLYQSCQEYRAGYSSWTFTGDYDITSREIGRLSQVQAAAVGGKDTMTSLFNCLRNNQDGCSARMTFATITALGSVIRTTTCDFVNDARDIVHTLDDNQGGEVLDDLIRPQYCSKSWQQLDPMMLSATPRRVLGLVCGIGFAATLFISFWWVRVQRGCKLKMEGTEPFLSGI